MAEVRAEYAIEWTAPVDIAGSITLMGQGEFNRERAHTMLNLTYRLPGGQRGRVVSRTITWSDWEAVDAGS